MKKGAQRDAREGAIVRNIQKSLQKVPGLIVRKRWGTAMGIAGDPDLSGCYRGRHFELEVKTPANAPTILQLTRMEQWRRAGAIVAVVTNAGEALDALGVSSPSSPAASGES